MKAWATASMLKVNNNKAKGMLVTPKGTKHPYNSPTSITVGSAQIPFKLSVIYIGFTLDSHLTMHERVFIIV